jgi:hypothetical protein
MWGSVKSSSGTQMCKEEEFFTLMSINSSMDYGNFSPKKSTLDWCHKSNASYNAHSSNQATYGPSLSQSLAESTHLPSTMNLPVNSCHALTTRPLRSASNLQTSDFSSNYLPFILQIFIYVNEPLLFLTYSGSPFFSGSHFLSKAPRTSICSSTCLHRLPQTL